MSSDLKDKKNFQFVSLFGAIDICFRTKKTIEEETRFWSHSQKFYLNWNSVQWLNSMFWWMESENCCVNPFLWRSISHNSNSMLIFVINLFFTIIKHRILNAIKSVRTAGGVIMTKFANVPWVIWDNIVKPHSVIHSVWMGAFAQRQRYAHAQKDIKEGIVKEVNTDKWNSHISSISFFSFNLLYL